MTLKMQEKRKFPRFNAPFDLKLSIAPGGSELSGTAQDVSMSGVRAVVRKDSEISTDNAVFLHFLFPQKTLEIEGKVKWIKDTDDHKELGILFMKISGAFKDDIYDFISRYHRQQLLRNWWQLPPAS